MPHSDLPALYAYTAWANGRVLEACAALTHEQWSRDLGNSFASIRDTMAHIAGAEWVWLQRWLGVSPTALPDEWRESTPAELSAHFAEVQRQRDALLARLTTEQLERPLAYTNTAGRTYAEPLWQQLRHVVNHSAYHRGQVVTMLRQLGATPPTTDLIVYFREADAQPSQPLPTSPR